MNFSSRIGNQLAQCFLRAPRILNIAMNTAMLLRQRSQLCQFLLRSTKTTYFWYFLSEISGLSL